jgi:hypothetical protein
MGGRAREYLGMAAGTGASAPTIVDFIAEFRLVFRQAVYQLPQCGTSAAPPGAIGAVPRVSDEPRGDYARPRAERHRPSGVMSIMQQARASNSNLFAIDHAAIKATLQDANAQLLDRRDQLLAAFSRAPQHLLDEDVERANRFVRQLDTALREARQARISDGRPFRVASETVKVFFDAIEKPLQEALRAMLARLTDAAERARSERAGPATGALPVGMDVSGATIVTVGQAATARANIRLAWSVEGFSRDEIDLEALRLYLTDAAILAACRKHLAQNGPHQVAGVEYREVAQRS